MAKELPEWIKEFRRRTRIIEIIAKAYDPDVSDAEIREELINIGEEWGEMMQFPPMTAPMPSGGVSRRRRRGRK